MKRLLFILILFLFINVKALEEVSFEKCVDGDTAWLKTGDISLKYRFLAIDTPETLHPIKDGGVLGKTASEYTCNSLMKASKIEIEYDLNSAKIDKYNRELVWIFIDGRLLQEDLIEKGYAKVEYIYGDYKYLDVLKIKEEIAKEEKIGIWGNKYTVTFVYKDKTDKIEVIEGTKIEPINTKDDKYLEWYYNDEPFNFETIIDKDIELIGKYNYNPIIVRIVLIVLFLILIYFIDRKKFYKITKKLKKNLVE